MTLVPLALALALAGCSWGTFHAGPDRTGWQVGESKVGVGNVAQLTQARAYTNAYSPPVIVGGILYSVTSNGFLQAFDATGATACSGPPVQCSPLWKSSVFAGRAVTVDQGKVYVAGDGGLRVFDAAGSTGSGCGGTPKVCPPLWTTGTFYNVAPASPAVVDGVVYVSGSRSILLAPGNAYVIAYDAKGSSNCSGAPKVCAPLWRSAPAATDVIYREALAVANGVVYATAGDKVVAFDAGGVTGCGGTPKVCAPRWSASPPTSLAYGGLAVANGAVFIAGYGQKLYAIDAAGTTGCGGTPKTCTALWSAQVGDTRNTPAVANGVVYVTNGSGTLMAFDAKGATHCTGSPKVCSPFWTHTPNESGYVVGGSPAVANGIVYTVSTGSFFRGFDAAGTVGCSGSPKTCTPLWSVTPGKISTDASPAIVDGTVYWNSGTVSTTWAYAL